jgi:methionyl-tRNA formyltransferase
VAVVIGEETKPEIDWQSIKYFPSPEKSNPEAVGRIVFYLRTILNTAYFQIRTMQMPRDRFVFMGSTEFGIPALELLLREGYDCAAVVSTPAKPSGRGQKPTESPVSTYCRQNALGPVICPETLRDPAFIEQLRGFQADWFIVVAFRILPVEVFSIPAQGAINIHASLLPRYRGPAPIQRAIEAGEIETGVSIFFIDKGIDTGRILMQRSTPIAPHETTPELAERLSRLGAEALRDALQGYHQGTLTALHQDDSTAGKAPKLRKDEALIDWRLPASTIFNRIRAFKPFPGAWTVLRGSRLGIEWAEPFDLPTDAPPGTVCEIGKEWFDVACAGNRLRVSEVKPEGKKRMPAGAFLRGTSLEEGIVLG